MSLEQRAEPAQLGALRIAPDDRVRVPDGDRRELHALAAEIERLPPPHLDPSDVEPDEVIVAHERRDLPLADAEHDAGCLRPAREPGGDDAGPVARQLRARPVRIPDPHLRAVAIDR